jgi:2-dehydropantoate 2-reductase
MACERVGIVGAGAVGCYFGGMLARAGVPVTLIGRPQHVDAIQRDGLFLDRSDFQGFIQLKAATNIDAIGDSSIVLLCVKTVDTEIAASAIAPYLKSDTLLVSFQNGVDNVERILRATGVLAIPAVVYVAAAMIGPGRVKHNGRGDIVIGPVPRLSDFLNSVGVPCRVSDNIAGDLWTKLVMNCAYNAISAVTHLQYLAIKDNSLSRDVMRDLVEEVVAVGTAAGVQMPSTDELVQAALKLGEAMSGATSSTEQDLTRGRPTEIDSLNGYVARRGEQLGIPTPVNRTLHALVKLIESNVRDRARIRFC